MKRRVVLILIVASALFFSKQIQAQRCLPGQMGIQLTTGLVDGFIVNPYALNFGYFFDGEVSWFLKHKNQAGLEFSYLEKFYPYEREGIPVTQYTGGGGFHYTLLSDSRSVFLLSAGVSGLLGYEIINRGNQLTYDGSVINHSDAFLYGGAVSLEAEIYLSNSFAWLFNVRQRFLGGSSVDRFHTQVGTGFKIIIN